MTNKRALKDAAEDPLVEKNEGLVEEKAGATCKTAGIGKVLLALLVGIGAGLVMGKFFKFRL